MFGRRLVIVVAIVMGLMALAATVAPPPQRTGPGAAGTPSPAPAGIAEPSGASPGDVTARLQIGSPVRAPVRARVGQNVTLDVSGDVVDAVVIPALGVLEPIDPASPAQIQLYAATAGVYPIRLLGSGQPIGVLRISPAS
jgi:hypothetical protein